MFNRDYKNYRGCRGKGGGGKEDFLAGWELIDGFEIKVDCFPERGRRARLGKGNRWLFKI